MKAKELTQKLREILGRDDIRFRLRYAKSRYGEVHGRFIALYGDFTTIEIEHDDYELPWENSNLWYSHERYEIIEKLKDAGLNVLDAPGHKFEILVEVDVYYIGDSEVKNYEFRDSNFHEDHFGFTYRTHPYKIVNSF